MSLISFLWKPLIVVLLFWINLLFHFPFFVCDNIHLSLNYLVNNFHAETLHLCFELTPFKCDLNLFSSDRLFSNQTWNWYTRTLKVSWVLFSDSVCVCECVSSKKEKRTTLHIRKFTIYTFDFYLSCLSNLYTLLFLFPLSFTTRISHNKQTQICSLKSFVWHSLWTKWNDRM